MHMRVSTKVKDLRRFPPGTVVRFADEHGGDNSRSYRVVFAWDRRPLRLR